MSTFAESLIKMIDSGDDILDIAKYFGGTQKLLNTSKKYLVNVLINAYGDDFPNLNDASKRLTAKKFIDELKKQYFYED